MITETLFNADNITATSPQLAQLKALFPNSFDVNGHFLIETFKQEIAEQTDISTEFYAMNWLGKSYAKLLRNLPPQTLLAEDKTHNAKAENANSQNLLIQGDNLEVLKHLKNAYANSIKMIYIDPPYNTGSDGFVYQDDRKFTPNELSRLANISQDEAERILNFTDKGSNSHSAWLTFMYPRLYVARELLKEDGVIFISIDDNEVAQLKLLCDEVFGAGNFVAQITWQKKTGASDAKKIAIITEYIFVYQKTNDFIANKNSDSYDFNRYKLQDKHIDTRGNYYIDNLDRGGLQYSDSLNFGIECPDGKIAFPNGRKKKTQEGWIWKWSKNKIEWAIENDFLEFRKSSQKECGWSVCYKNYLYVDNEGQTVERAAPYKNLITDILNTNGNNEIKEVFDGKKYFSFPKSILLIQFFLKIALNKNDTILDFFAGSGTTAHAVMQQNAEDNGKRQFICVQLPEKTDSKSEAYKAGYHTIFDITKARIEKAAKKIQTDQPDAKGDFGFKIYQTTDNFRDHSDDAFSPEQPSLPNVQTLNYNELYSLLTTWAVHDGAMLTTPIETVEIGDYTAYLCEKRLYLMHESFSSADLLAFIDKLDNDSDFNPNRVILFGEHIESSMQQEINQALATYSNRKSISLSLIVRV